MWVCRLPVHIDPAVCTCFLQNCSANLQLPNGPTESSAPTTSLSSPCRGGRLCPPAERSGFFGNLRRIRNFLTGRCGHRPLQRTVRTRGSRASCEHYIFFIVYFASRNYGHVFTKIPLLYFSAFSRQHLDNRHTISICASLSKLKHISSAMIGNLNLMDLSH